MCTNRNFCFWQPLKMDSCLLCHACLKHCQLNPTGNWAVENVYVHSGCLPVFFKLMLLFFCACAQVFLSAMLQSLHFHKKIVVILNMFYYLSYPRALKMETSFDIYIMIICKYMYTDHAWPVKVTLSTFPKWLSRQRPELFSWWGSGDHSL